MDTHRHPRLFLVITAAAVVACVAAGAAVVTVRLRAQPPLPSVSLRSAATLMVGPAAQLAVTMPVSGSIAVEVSGPRLLPGTAARVASRDADAPHPIASLAKALTAFEVLKLRPLAAGEEGPQYRITAQDVADFRAAAAGGGSYVAVSQGELFTERQLLLALLLPSGNNIAETLARWAGGSRDAFLVEAAATARSLGMTATHLVDPSGFDPGTVASAADLARLGRAVLEQPALAAIVATQHATLPDGTAIDNLDTALHDAPGWLGIKTGNTDAAGGCLLFAARRAPDGDPDPADAVTVVGAVLGQHSTAGTPAGDRGVAILAARAAVDSALRGFTPVRPGALAPAVDGTVTAPWGGSTPVALGDPTAPQPWVASAGSDLALRVSTAPAAAPLAAGAVVGRVEALAGGTLIATWPVQVLRAVPAPDWTWRLEHG
jgi:D-alanyl-D-alanine carboxypeptidase (penicillin-binding protein 5/6)